MSQQVIFEFAENKIKLPAGENICFMRELVVTPSPPTAAAAAATTAAAAAVVVVVVIVAVVVFRC